jgi:DNA processing protein
MRTIDIHDPEYPKQLLAMKTPPTLWVDGGPLCLDGGAVAIVGPREPSERGLVTARALGVEIARRGKVVISGGATGIDTAAHLGAATVGVTWVVLPCGLEEARSRPHANIELFERVKLSGGGLLSTFEPTMKSLRGNHHARNAIIAQLVHDLIVVQAEEGSGSVSVGRKGLTASKRVFTFRGPCYDPLFDGTRQLLRLGAVEPESVAALIDAVTRGRDLRALNEDEKLVLAQLGNDVVVEGPSGHFRRKST